MSIHNPYVYKNAYSLAVRIDNVVYFMYNVTISVRNALDILNYACGQAPKLLFSFYYSQ